MTKTNKTVGGVLVNLSCGAFNTGAISGAYNDVEVEDKKLTELEEEAKQQLWLDIQACLPERVSGVCGICRIAIQNQDIDVPESGECMHTKARNQAIGDVKSSIAKYLEVRRIKK